MPGAGVLGFLAAAGAWFLVGWSNDPSAPLRDILQPALVLGSAFGVPMGIGFWYEVRRYKRTGKW